MPTKAQETNSLRFTAGAISGVLPVHIGGGISVLTS